MTLGSFSRTMHCDCVVTHPPLHPECTMVNPPLFPGQKIPFCNWHSANVSQYTVHQTTSVLILEL